MKVKNEIKETGQFLRHKIGRTIIWVAIIFFATIVVSAFVFYKDTDSARLILEDYMNNVSGMTDDSGNIQLLELFKNNLFACVICIAIGVIPFIFLPAISLIANGTMIGTILGFGAATGALNVFNAIVFGLLPHGIFEVPAMIISMALGFHLCKTLSVKIITRNRETKILELLNEITRAFVVVILPLVIMAALVECYITPSIMNLGM